jgi:transcription elongation factor B subunit 1
MEEEGEINDNIINDIEENEIQDESSYVKLISSDGHVFVVSKDAARVSGTLSNMLGDSFTFAEANSKIIKLHDMDGPVLEKVVEYLYYNAKYKDSVDVPEFAVPTEMALELLVAADFLHV